MAVGKRLVLLLILLLATGLRFYRLDTQSFWNDEGNSARLSERSLRLIIEGTASDVHPPLYYLMLRGWRELVGEHEFGLRSFSAFAGVLTVAVTMALGHWLAGWRLAGVAGFLTAVHPALIYYSQETRMYALLALWAILSTYLLLRLEKVHWQLTINHWPLIILYTLTLTAGLYTHYFFPAILVVHGLILITSAPPLLRSSAPLLKWLGIVGTAVLLYTPWLPILLRQIGGRPETDITFLQFLHDAGNWLAFGQTLSVGWGLWLVASLVMLGVLPGRARSRIPLIATFIPLLFMVVAGSTAPQFYKFLLTAVPFLCLLLAFAIHNSQFTRHCLLFTVHCLLFTDHALPKKPLHQPRLRPCRLSRSGGTN